MQALKEKKLDITLNNPIERGKIKDNNWDQMKVFLNYLILKKKSHIGNI